MAKLEQALTGNFDEILHRIEKGILEGSVSATLEDSATFRWERRGAAFGFLNGSVMQEVIG